MPEKISEDFNVLSVKLEGRNLIEAAAGTGKTYSIAIMILRWIVDTDYTIDSVLAVTFTNYATAELKERIIKFLEEAVVFFETGKCNDQTIEKVCCRIPEENRKNAVRKLKKAINDFDTASIFTIHGFCRKLIKEHAFEIGIDFKMELSDEVDPANNAATAFFRTNITDYNAIDATGGRLLENKEFRKRVSKDKLKEFISKAGIGVENKKIKVESEDLDESASGKLAEIYRDFAERAAMIAKENREKKNVMGYDDILLILYGVLQDKKSKAATALPEIMAEQYSLVLIDEFQDTDPLQYFIFKTLFCNGRHVVFFIGDPKQSIYAFRKADIFSYIEAAKENWIKKYVMKKNFRSSPAALAATNEVFSSNDIFGADSPIKYEPVEAAKKEEECCLKNNGHSVSGMLVREVGYKTKNEINKKICDHVTQAVFKMIKPDSSFKIVEKKNDDITERTVVPSDIAVLVATNDFALEICEKLNRAGIPAVFEADNAKELYIFASEEASAMQKLIAAAVTGEQNDFKALLLTFFYNKTVDDIACENDMVAELCKKFVSCFKDWSRKGFYAVFSKFIEDKNILLNILKKGNERRLSILRQLAELINNHESSIGDFSVIDTQKWFDGKINSESSGNEDENIRPESGKKECVRIMTLHKSKGLEFNIVFFPFMLSTPAKEQWMVLHSKNDDGVYERELLLAKPGPFADLTDEALEEIRRVYVGITRAKYLTVCYTRDPNNNKKYLESTDLFVKKEKSRNISFDQIRTDNAATSSYDAENINTPSTELLPSEEAERSIKTDWALTSFSEINSHGHKEELSSDDYDKDYEYDEEGAEGFEDTKNEENKKTVQMALFPSGTEAGTVLHSILEEADFASEDNTALIRTVLKKKMNLNKDEFENMVLLLNECLNCVFDAPLFEGKTLRDIKEKITEMEFFLSIENDVCGGKLSKIIEDNYKTTELYDDSVKKGYLHGYIDLVAKVDGKYYIIDWKSNNLKEAGDTNDPYSAYDAESLEKEMKKHNYYLQYMLYLTAFDKYMRKVDPDYSYEKDFGGIRYVFLRGVKAGSCENGIFYDRPAESELRKIQQLFKGEK